MTLHRCLMDGCTRPHKALGLCEKHYVAHRSGSLDVQVRPSRDRLGERLWCDCPQPTPGPGFWSFGCDACGLVIRPAQRSQRKGKAA